MNRLPVYFKQDLPDQKTFSMMHLFSEFGVHTVCQEARCPNITYCFQRGKATLMILGVTCTRSCRFCAVAKSAKRNLLLDENEPERISRVVRLLGLNYVVITSVTRDDLPDGGAGVFARSVELIRRANKNIKIEVLIPDFKGKVSCLALLLNAEPDVLSHNIETVPRLYQVLRPQADYQVSLQVLSRAKKLKPKILTKSSLMLGLGEDKEEVITAMRDLRDHQCDILTLGQYLSPSQGHYPVQEFIDLEEFQELENIALGLGFWAVSSGPKVRTSYQADAVYRRLSECKI